jgi:hypothetical protein
MNGIRNEQIKLTATYLNGLAIALFAVGSLAPTFSYAFGSFRGTPIWVVLGAAAICLFASVALHWLGRRILRSLTP